MPDLQRNVPSPLRRLRGVSHDLVAMTVAGMMALVAAPWLREEMSRAAAVSLGAGLLTFGLGRLWQYTRLTKGALPARAVGEGKALWARDPAPILLTTGQGAILFRNPAAQARFAAPLGAEGASRSDPPDEATVGEMDICLAQFVASPRALVARLSARAQAQGSAVEDISIRDGALRLTVQWLAGEKTLLWRIDSFAGKVGAHGGAADGISLPMLTANKAGVVLYSNAALRRILGRRPTNLRELTGSQPWRAGEEVEIASESGPQRVLLAELASTGERREIYLLPLPKSDAAGAVSGTDFEQMPVALMIFSPEGAVRSANRAARDILGDTLREGAFFHDLFDALGRPVSDWLADVAEERLPAGGQVLRLNRGNAETSDFMQVALRRMVERGRPSVLAVIQDANAMKVLEAQFVQSQKMEAIGQLAGGVAHDFNNLLTAISGNCDLLLLRHTGDDPSYPDLMQIRQNANRAAALVAQLLAFSRKQNLQPEYLDMQEVFSDLTHLLNRLVGEKLRLALNHDSDLGTIRADRRQLEQVIMNLVVNARDAMPKGGTISISTEAAHLAENLVRDRAIVPAGDYAKITVADTGTGIADDLLPKIFEPFYTTKKAGEGTGLGLSTAYGIVKQSGGFIFVDSVLGEGTRFTLYFPIHTRPATEAQATPAKPAVMRQGEGVVLLVEDEAPVRAFAARALRLRGYTVLEAATGEEALETLGDTGLQVDLFLSDVIMPGMDGPTWVREAHRDRPDVPVIFVSGYAEDVMSEHQQRIAHSTFLPKPFSLADLTLAVQNQINAQPIGGNP